MDVEYVVGGMRKIEMFNGMCSKVLRSGAALKAVIRSFLWSI